MKRQIIIVSLNLLVLGLLLLPTAGKLLAETEVGSTGGVLVNPLQADTFTELLDLILNAVVQVGLVVVTFFIIYAGYLYVRARGNSTDIKNAHETIKWTIVGSAIVLGAYAIKAIIYNTVTGLTNGIN